MARFPGAGGLEALLLLTICLNFGNGLHLEVFSQEGRNDHLFNQNSKARQKREWQVSYAIISEEDNILKRNPIAKINSDHKDDPGMIITYFIEGEGVTKPPYGLFVIDRKTGDLNITRKVDREQTPVYFLQGFARDQYGRNLESPLDLRIKVEDINDNSPMFTKKVFVGSVEELNEKGTLVMKINAKDEDEPNNLNSKIAFKIISEDSGRKDSFQINKNTGEITTRLNLDREEKSNYTLTVEARDRDGDVHGLANTCTVKIKILDVNDNLPVLERERYEASVEENRANVKMIRLKVSDKDEEFSDNWLANFTIIGDKGGYFRIETNRQTNEGVLILVKEINYEEIQSMTLSVVVTNKAAFHKSISHSYREKRVPVTIKVINVLEGPVFKPSPLVIQTNETMTVNRVIRKLQVYEDYSSTKLIERVTYTKVYDADDWIMIGYTTGEIKLIKVPDYESSHVINGTYTVIVTATTIDYPKKTANNTIVIRVSNNNDNCPTILAPVKTECSNAKFFSFTAEDRDGYPHGAPFTFTVIDEPKGVAKKWVIGHVNETSMKLLLPQDVEPGIYKVPVLVKDVQGLSCAEQESLTLTVCTCVEGACRDTRINSRVALGAGAVVLIILAILLLLRTKGFTAIPDNYEETLREWNSEGAAPEDKAVLLTPTALDNSTSNMRSGAAAAMGVKGAATGGGSYASSMKEHYGNANMGNSRWEEQRHILSSIEYGAMAPGGLMAVSNTMTMGAGKATGAGGTMVTGAGGTMMTGAGGTMAVGAGETMTMGGGEAINEEFLRDYFSNKAVSFVDVDEAQLVKDCLLLYCQEDVDSSHGSVGCCSCIEEDFDDHFLDDLGDEFKTLADICLGKPA